MASDHVEAPCHECGDAPCPAHAASRRLADLVECPRCGEVMDDPRVLHCLHTACLACLAAEHRGNCIRCPLCSFATTCPAAHVLPRNTYIEAEHRRRKGVKGCRNCSSREPTTYCAACAALLCAECDTLIHSNPIFKKHPRHPTEATAPAPQDVEEAGENSDVAAVAAAVEIGCLPVPVACPRHGSSILSAFCTQCTVAVCAACVTESHRGHAVRPLGPTAAHIIATAPKAVSGLASVTQHLSTGVRDVRKCERGVEDAATECDAIINDACDRLVETINARRVILLSQNRDVSDRKHALLGAQRASLEQMIDSINRSQQLCAALTHNAGDFMLPELASIGAHAEAYCSFVRGQRLDVDPCVDSEIKVKFGSDLAASRDASSSSTQRTTEETELAKRLESLGAIVARAVMERRFSFSSVGDHQGVLYYLGTSRGIKLYENPCTIGRAQVSSSSVGYGRTENVVGDGANDFCTHNEPFSWIAVDLEAPVCVDHYSVHHDAYDKDSHFLRNWELQGWRGGGGGGSSVEGDAAGEWDSLAAHHNDKSLSERTPSASWAVRGCRQEGYRRLRLVLTGPNSHGNHYLMVSGVEFYGVLLG